MLDLFCRAGGASMGYHRAGFDVDGCDIEAQKRYPFRFLQMDWRECLEKHGHEYDAFAASPECQGYCDLRHFVKKSYRMEIPNVRDALQATGKPYVIENVPGAIKHMICPLVLCGSMFGLQTACGAQLRRHRLFESNLLLMSPGPCRHGETTIAVQGHQATNEAERRRLRATISVCGDTPHNPRTWRAKQRGMRTISITGKSADNPRTVNHGRTIMVVGDKPRDAGAGHLKRRYITITGSTAQRQVVKNSVRETFTVDEARAAMGIDWMVMSELSQAIPPAYTEWIGWQMMEALR